MFEQGISRRTLLKGLGIAGVGAAGMALTGCSSSDATTDATEEVEELVISSTVDADIVVCGGGYSGLVAAVQAAELGKKVIVLEKEASAGGSGLYTEGICGINTSVQEEQGVVLDQTIDEIVADEMMYNRYRTPQNVWKYFLNSTADNLDWLMENGVGIGEVTDQAGVGNTLQVFHWWEMNEGEEGGGACGQLMIEALLAKLDEYGAELYLSTPAVQLVLNEAGDDVAGVIGTDADGVSTQFNGSVILATGGTSGNPEYVTEVSGCDSTRMQNAAMGGDGDGYTLGRSVDGRQSALNFFVGGRYVYGSTSAQAQIAATIQDGLLYVNNCGVRFMAEDIGVKTLSTYTDNAICLQPKAYTVMDQASVDRLATEGNRIDFMWFPAGTLCDGLQDELDAVIALDCDSAYVADSIEELAAQAGIDVDTLVETVATYNTYVENGVDEDYGKDAQYMDAVSTPPYYLVRHDRSAVRLAGNLDIDHNNRVVKVGGDVFNNLYAIGSDGCVLYDTSYNFHIPATMSGWCTHSGRNAAKNAAGE